MTIALGGRGELVESDGLDGAAPVLGRLTTAAVGVLAGLVFARVSPVIEETREWPSFMIPACAGLALTVLLVRLAEGRHPSELLGPATVAVLLFLGLLVAVRLPGLIHADNQEALFEGLVALAKDCFVGAALVFAAERTVALKAAVWGVVAAGSTLGALTLHKVATGALGNDYGGFSRSADALVTASENGIRYTGPLDDPNFFAQILIVAVAMAVARFWYTSSPIERLLMAGAVGVCLTGIGFTLSRGGLMASAVVIVTSVVFRFGRWALILMVFVGAVVTGVLPGSVIARVASVAEAPRALAGSDAVDPSIQGRTSETLVAVSMFLDHPVLGVGFANYEDNYLSYSTDIGLDSRRIGRAAHNLFLEVAAEQGLFGLGGFFGFVGAAVMIPGRVRRRCLAVGDVDGRATAEALQLAVIGYLITAIFLHDAFSRVFVVLMALAIGALMLDGDGDTTTDGNTNTDGAPDPLPSSPGDRRLRVVQVVDSLTTGGAERLVAEFGLRAERLDLDIEIVSLGMPTDSPVTRDLFEQGVTVRHAPSTVTYGLLDRTRKRRLLTLIRRADPDVVHLHLETATIIGGRITRKLAIPTVVTIHDPKPNLGRGFRIKSWWLRRRLRQADRLIAVGPAVADAWSQRLNGTPIEVLLSPARIERRFRPRSSGGHQRREPVTLISIGRLTEHKAIPDLLEAVAILIGSHPDLRLKLVGDGPERQYIEQRITDLELDDTVELLGIRHDIDELLSEADLFVLPSHQEGLPLALLEAMAAGLPVVATDVGDVGQVLPAEAGALVPPGRPTELAEAIAVYLDDSEARKVAGRIARRQVEVEHHPDRWADRLHDLYKDLDAATRVDDDTGQPGGIF